jgi:hypothetical protein
VKPKSTQKVTFKGRGRVENDDYFRLAGVSFFFNLVGGYCILYTIVSL